MKTAITRIVALVLSLVAAAAWADVVQLPGTTPQHAIVNHAFAVPLAVRVTNAQGAPMASTQVLFSVEITSNAGFGAARDQTVTVLTDAQGVATAPPLYGMLPGAFRAAATVPALFLTQVTFDLTVGPQAIASFRALTPLAQGGQGGTSTILRAMALDADGQPVVQGWVTVTSVSTASNEPFGCNDPASSTSTFHGDTNGQVFVQPVFPSEATCTVTITAAGAATPRIDFKIVGWYPAPLLKEPAAPVSAFVNEPFSVPMLLTLRDGQTAVPSVSFNVGTLAETASATMAPSSITTDIAGRATLTGVADSRAGTYDIVLHYTLANWDLLVPMRNIRRTQVPVNSPRGGSVTVTVQSPAGACGFATWASIDERAGDWALAPRANPTLDFQNGLVNLALADCPAGQPLTLRITYPNAIRAGSGFWSYGPDASGVSAWRSIPMQVSGNDAIVSITDGGLGDNDQRADGSLRLVGGIALQHVLTANYQDMWWAGSAENGWGMSVVQHGDKLFSVIYAYDDAGAATWYVMPAGQWNATTSAYAGALYHPSGSPFFAYDVARFAAGAAVGTATLTFTDANHATLDDSINGKSGHKAITRQAFGDPFDTAVYPARGDMWWGGTLQNGWGIAVLQQYGTLFCVWFTYDASGVPTWYVMPGGSWTDADTYAGRIYRTTGSPWVGRDYDPSLLRATDVGPYRLRFSGDSATLDYAIEGRTGTLSLSRQPF